MNSGSISYSPDYKSEKKKVNVRISKQTGGAYADPHEVIEDEMERIKRDYADYGRESERARLEREVIRCARLLTKIKDGPLDATWVDRTALADNDLDDAVRKLEAFESAQEGKK